MFPLSEWIGQRGEQLIGGGLFAWEFNVHSLFECSCLQPHIQALNTSFPSEESPWIPNICVSLNIQLKTVFIVAPSSNIIFPLDFASGMDYFCLLLLPSFVKKDAARFAAHPLDVAAFLWGFFGFLGLDLFVVFFFSGDFLFVLVEVWWGSEGFCELLHVGLSLQGLVWVLLLAEALSQKKREKLLTVFSLCSSMSLRCDPGLSEHPGHPVWG